MNTVISAAESVTARPYSDSLRRVLDGKVLAPKQTAAALPAYLVKHYWWAYVWPPAVWFFDHQPIINAIVFGQYRKITDHTLRLLDPANAGATLLIASAYGNLVPRLAGRMPDHSLTVIDAAPIQLERAANKLCRADLTNRTALTCMHAEHLRYPDNSFDSALMFLLLHELPPEARRQSLAQAVRCLRPGGQLVIAEYGELTDTHLFHRLAPMRWIFGVAEPFLPGLWQEDLDGLVAQAASGCGKQAVCEDKVAIFGGFYRVMRYRIERP